MFKTKLNIINTMLALDYTKVSPLRYKLSTLCQFHIGQVHAKTYLVFVSDKTIAKG